MAYKAGIPLRSPERPDVSIENSESLISAVKSALKRSDGQQELDANRLTIRKNVSESPAADPNGFERILGKSDLLSINFLDRGRRAADAVCRIRVPAAGGAGWMATGFLVGPRLLLTNNHVLPDQGTASQAECEFGYEADLDGVLKSAVKFNLMPAEIFFTDMASDFTLVAIAPFSEGDVPVQRYGYLPLIPASGKAIGGEWVTIVQHPGGQPKQVAIKASEVLELDQALVPDVDLNLFIHYSTDTEPGSSGAPVLNDQWQVVALHHKAIPAPDQPVEESLGAPPGAPKELTWLANQGVRVSGIYNCLERHRFTNRDAAGALGQLERGLGITPLIPVSAAPELVATEADRKALPLSDWADAKKAGKLGYDPKFLSVELPLEAILAGQKAAAAPLRSGNGVALDYLHFSTVIHKERKLLMLSAVNIDGSSFHHPGSRQNPWRRDARMDDEYQPAANFYEVKLGNDPVQFSRGHMVRRIDPCWGTPEDAKLAEMHTFHYSNAMPQVQGYNDVEWGNLEDYIIARAQELGVKISVFSGPIFRDKDPEYGQKRKMGPWRIPVSYWKVVAAQRGEKKVTAFAIILGQSQYVQALYEATVFKRLTPYSFSELKTLTMQTTIRTVEDETGFDFGALKGFDTVAALESTRQTRFLQNPGDLIF